MVNDDESPTPPVVDAQAVVHVVIAHEAQIIAEGLSSVLHGLGGIEAAEPVTTWPTYEDDDPLRTC